MPYVNMIKDKDTGTEYELTPSSTAALYSASSTYAVGDFCYYDGTLYRCKTAITTGEAWTAAHWEATTVGDSLNDDVSNLKDNLSQLTTATTEDEGRFLRAKTVRNGKVLEWEFADAETGLEPAEEVSF